jgi:eukaryotic-like serine/threonine-protein kinase
MDSNQDRLKEILAGAVARRDPAMRAAYLAEACGADDQLRAKVEGLIRAYEEKGDRVEQALPVPDRPPESPGTMVGRYKLLQEIGEGGFGLVFMAEQTEPVHRRVALKVIKAGMDTREVIARFESERQALALMDHPNIAKILDAGVTGVPDPQPSTLNPQPSSGRPYFVMELVNGIPITKVVAQLTMGGSAQEESKPRAA